MTPAARKTLDALADTLADKVADIIRPLRRRLDDLEAEAASLRRALSSVSGEGVRRQFVEVRADPAHPGCSQLVLDDGSHVSLPDERLSELATAPMAGRA
jgi:hypothetical protein